VSRRCSPGQRTLWFDLETIGTWNLRDASDVDRLIGKAYNKFRESTNTDR